MLLEELELLNFKQYRGKHKISFATTKEKNVTVILGDNASGKTTLIEAVYWILYAKTDFKASNLLNLEVADKLDTGKYEMIKGRLKLIHDGIEYEISRSQRYTLDEKDNLIVKEAEVKMDYKLANGLADTIKSEQEIKMKINKILAEDEADSILFDAKKIAGLLKRNKAGQRDLSNVVDSILDLDDNSKTIIMDDPFATIDGYHAEKLSEILVELKEKIIIFLTDVGWEHVKHHLTDKVNCLYQLEKKSLNQTEIKTLGV